MNDKQVESTMMSQLEHLDQQAQTGASLVSLGQLLSGRLQPHEISTQGWEDLLQLAIDQQMFTLVYKRYREAFPSLSPAPLYNHLEFSSAAHTLQLELIATEINEELTRAGIPAVFLKGIVLAQTVYPEPSLRQMRDIDVLVPFEKRHEALAALKGLGFVHTANGITPKDERYDVHYTLHYLTADNPFFIELHYQLLGFVAQPVSANYEDWFWQRTRRIATDIGEITSFTPEAMFLHLVLHDVFHHEQRFPDTYRINQFSLRRKYDLYLLLNETKLDFEEVYQGALLLDCLYAVVAALEDQQHYFGMDFAALITRFKGDRFYPVRFGARERKAIIRLREVVYSVTHFSFVTLMRNKLILEDASLRTTLSLPPDAPIQQQHQIYRWLHLIRESAVGILLFLVHSIKYASNSLKRGAADSKGSLGK